MLLLLIRHGENEYVKEGRLAGRLPGVSLNEKGRQQAQAIAAALAQAPVKAVYTSPLERAVETAAPLAAALGLPAVVEPGLIETDPGEWTGLKLKDLRRRKEWQTLQAVPSRFTFPGGESIADCQRRLVQTVDGLCARHAPDDIVVCFSHADPIKLIAAWYTGLALDHFQRLAVSPGSVTTLHLGPASAALIHLNHAPAGLSFPSGSAKPPRKQPR